MKDNLVSLAFLILPTLAIAWAWKNRIRVAVGWRERLSLLALTVLAADLVYSAVFLLWPYFGAKQGSGVGRWQITAQLVAFGFWLSAFALTSAIVCKCGTTAKARVGQRFVLVLLSLAAMFFWFAMAIPVSDFHAIEGAREAASHASETK